MRLFDRENFSSILQKIKNDSNSVIETKIDLEEITEFKYYLIKNFTYPVIIDDYKYGITDKDSFLEALYYQARLITVHNSNWDAFHEGLRDLINNISEYEILCLMIRQSENLNTHVDWEINLLKDIIKSINEELKMRKIVLIMNNSSLQSSRQPLGKA